MKEKIAVVVGASSGIGFEVSRLLLQDGWTVGVAARRGERLELLRRDYPAQVVVQPIDVTRADAPDLLMRLFRTLGGVELYVHVAGIGRQNVELSTEVEVGTVNTNVMGFTQMVDTAFREMADSGGGQIAVVSSIAGTKGLGAAPSYSATKAFQNTYVEALAQLAAIRGLNITLTDLRPGFVDTDLLKGDRKYPMLLDKRKVARCMVKAIYRKRSVRVIDWRYRVLTVLWKMIPSALWRRWSLR